MKSNRIRGLFALGLVAVVCLGLLFHTGTGTFSAFGIGSIAALCPLGILESLFAGDGWSPHLVLAAIVLVLIVLFGKFFCAWGCPVPWLQSFLKPGKRKSPEDVFSRKTATPACAKSGGSPLPPVGGERDGVRIDSRHIVLGGVLASCAIFGFPVFCLVCPVGLTIATLIGLWHLFQFNEFTWGLLVFPLIVVAELTVLRTWCFRFCPISALVALVANGNRLFRPRVDRAACLRSHGIDCRQCVEVCPERLDPHSPVIPECSKCLKCQESCPKQAITMGVVARASANTPDMDGRRS